MATTEELQNPIATRPILGINVAVSSYEQLIQRSFLWGRERQSRAIFFANVHMIMEAHDDPAFFRLINRADMVNPDGMPLVWALHALGEKNAQRVCGFDATMATLDAAEKAGVPVGFYGNTPAALDALVRQGFRQSYTRRDPSRPAILRHVRLFRPGVRLLARNRPDPAQAASQGR